MWKNVSLLVVAALSLAWGGHAAAADVELTRVGNDPATGWCDINARALAQGATLNVQIQGRSKSSAQVAGKIRMKSQTDKFEWVSGEPTVTFTRIGSSPTSFGVKAKTTAPMGTYSVAFAAVDASNGESSRKSCTIEVVAAAAGGIGGRPSPGGLPGQPPVSVALTVSPPSGATSITQVTVRAVAGGGVPAIERPGLLTPSNQCLYRAIPTSGGMEQRQDQWDVGCLGWTTTLTPGTYTLQVTYRKMDMRMSTDYYAQVTNYVVTPARVLTTPKRLAPVVELSVNPMSGATTDTSVQVRAVERMAPPPIKACQYRAVPTTGGAEQRRDDWDVGCAGWTITLAPGTYTLRVIYGYKHDAAEQVYTLLQLQSANYAVTPGARLVEVASIQIDPQQPITGQEVTARMTIKNSGARDLANVPWWILFNETTVGTGVQSSLPRRGSADVTGRWTLRTAGTLRVVGLVDPLNTLGEPTSAQGDNKKEFQVNVAQGSTPGGGTATSPGLIVRAQPGSPAPPETPLLLDVRYVQSGPPGGIAEAWVHVCNVDPDTAYHLYAKGRHGSSGWEELVSIPRAGNLSSDSYSNPNSFSRDSRGFINPCPSNVRFESRLYFKLRLGLGDCCTSITYQAVARNRNGESRSNFKELSTPSTFFPCSPVPLCVKQEQ